MSEIFTYLFILSILTGQITKPLLQMGSGVTILDIVVTLFCLVGLIRVKFKLKKPPLLIKTALIFTLVAILSLILSPLQLSLGEKLVSLGYTARFFLYILAGWLIYSGAFPPFRSQIPKILLFSGIGLAVLGLLQFIFIRDLGFLEPLDWDPHYFRTVSTFLDPNFVGCFFVLTLILLINFKLRGKNYFLLLVFIALLTTFSRGAILMFFVCFITFSILKKSVKLFLLTSLLTSILIIGYSIYSPTVAKPHNIDREQSAEYRLRSWQQGLELFKEYPVFGVGFNSYRYGLKEKNLADENFLKTRGSTSNDSSLLHAASTTGVIGLVTYLYLLGALLYWSRRNQILFCSTLALIAHSFFANSLFYPFILIWVILYAIHSSKT